MEKLAIKGGNKVRTTLFPSYDVIGQSEQEAVAKVLESTILSKFLGAWHEDFYGGPEIKALEEEWATHFNVKHAVSVNSATSGLYCAIGAANIGPGDEVIVSPYTMSASATAPLIFNAIPIFADIDPDTFCLSVQSIEEKITPRTKAIIVVDLFGHPYDYIAINALAKKHHLTVIEDAAQAPGAMADGKYAGTLGDMGVFSLNYHKHIHSGEGGILVTNDDELAERVRLIRNHAEAVIGNKGYANLINMIGFNFRMTEIEAAITRTQLKKLTGLISERQENVTYIESKLKEIPFLTMPEVKQNFKHAYYVHAIKFDAQIAGVSRNAYIEAVKAELQPIKKREAEGVKISVGYVKPLYLQPIFQQQIGYGDKGCPFTCAYYGEKLSYAKGIAPVCEDMHENQLFLHELMRPGMTRKDLDDVCEAFIKVYKGLDQLKE